MGASQIYDIRNNDRIETLLNQASGGSGATLLIPDLQRPYVWTPSQVTLLVDSLVHGWPFGTLLLWKVDDTSLADIPHRQFWRVVDRTEDDDHPGVPEVSASLPAQFRMVLDGQQRMQSLVLAFGGDGNGFRLTDRRWFDGLDRERPRGRATAHWTFGQLCLDMDAFARKISAGVGVRDIDYREVLAWVVRAPKDGISAGKRPANYNPPLEFAAKHPGRFVALPRLWQLASSSPVSEFDYLKKLEREFLPAQEVQPDRIGELREPLAQLVKVLEEVKGSQVGVLELRAFNTAVGDKQDRYNDAIVNIFTRLNTAGRTLTSEEITFAWIKSNWNLGPALPAEKAFRDLRSKLASRGLEMSTDEVVQAVALVWAVLQNGGVALGPKDLLHGQRVKPMVPEITGRWIGIEHNLLRTAHIVEGLHLEYGRHFQSLNAFLLLSLWRMVGQEWLAVRKPGVIERAEASKALDDLVRTRAERWFALTSWAGRWRESSGEAVVQYLRELAGLWREASSLLRYQEIVSLLGAKMESWCHAVAADAETFVRDRLFVERREDVRAYFLPLWIWHRLDETRWSFSSVHLDAGKAKQSLEVDHIAAVALWNKCAPGPVGPGDPEDTVVVNDLGNTFLLEKNFNIGKSDKPLATLLGKVRELEDDAQRKAFLEALAIDDVLLDPSGRTQDVIGTAIEKRGRIIRAELLEYIRGGRTTPTAAVPGVGGLWECLLEDGVLGGKTLRAVLTLEQSGTSVEGWYVYDDGSTGELEGELRGTQLSGNWKEKRKGGTVRFDFEHEPLKFSGRWEYKKVSDGAGAWSGTWTSPLPEE
jgi:hypothetical protein